MGRFKLLIIKVHLTNKIVTSSYFSFDLLISSPSSSSSTKEYSSFRHIISLGSMTEIVVTTDNRCERVKKFRVWTIDYRCDNRRFWLSAHDCEVPTPFSKPRSRTENSDLWSRLTHQLLGRLKSTIPNVQIYLPKKANSEKLGLGIDGPFGIVFFFRVCKWTCAWRGLMTDIFGLLESSAMQWYQDVAPAQKFFFFPSSHLQSLVWTGQCF
jgi:hypothetical protein